MRAFCTNEELKIYLTEIFLIYKRGHIWHELVATLVTNRILDPYITWEVNARKSNCSASRYQQGIEQYQSKLYLNKLWSAFKQGLEIFRAHSQGFLSLGQWKKELWGRECTFFIPFDKTTFSLISFSAKINKLTAVFSFDHYHWRG